MKAITIKQPWATLIVEGYKEYEFRTRKTKYRGEILIHAGKSVDKKAMERFKDLNLEYPLGCIIGVANIKDCLEVDGALRSKLSRINPNVYKGLITKPYWEGYAFWMDDIKKIKPIYMNGKLSIWECDIDVEDLQM